MIVGNGRRWMERLRKRVILFAAGRITVFALAVALMASTLMHYFFLAGSVAFVLSFLLIFTGLSLRGAWWKTSPVSISRFVDLHYQQAEESSALLLKSNLSLLEQLQVSKLDRVLPLLPLPAVLWQQFKVPLVLLVLSATCSVLVLQLPAQRSAVTSAHALVKTSHTKSVKENVPAQISSFQVLIRPPAYTGKGKRTQAQFTLNAEEGALVTWEINTSPGPTQLSLVFNDLEQLSLRPLNDEHTSWSVSKQLFKPGFYQVLLDGKRSDFYQIEMISDQPVSIRILKPAQHSTIDVGQPQQLNLDVVMNDDYGLDDAWISATMSSGKGEAVSFKEKKILFTMPLKGKRQINVHKQIALKDLGMKPGDELYYYVAARDNHGQQSRSDMYFLSIQDTTELMSMAGIDNGVSLVPEYFRSERQLIIDTEKLLKEKATITESEFKQRSNDLGIDQKMLRLRYGKFLGEESETNIGSAHEDDHPRTETGSGQVGDVHEIMDQYAHKHDNAEDATFFEPALKAQLKATLTEMWGAELRLRTYLPQEALPFEYKALRLLKDLQQKSRAYVAKTTFKTTAFKPEKRLTGELLGIKGGDTKSTVEKSDQRSTSLRASLSVLETMKAGGVLQKGSTGILLAAQRDLLQAAALSPRHYLDALKALKKIVASGNGGEQQINAAERGISLLLGKAVSSPQQQSGSASSTLAQSYFKHLKPR